MTRRAVLIVLDGLGAGEAHDAAAYGDAGSATLGNVMRANPDLKLPTSSRSAWATAATPAFPRPRQPRAAHGWAQPQECREGQHDRALGAVRAWCSRRRSRPIRTAFRRRLLAEFAGRTNRAVIGNKAASGTAILDELGAEHMATGKWIVYTSADSVFQVAAHEDVVPLGELYAGVRGRAGAAGRSEWRVAGHRATISRRAGGVRSGRANRKDFSREPTGPTLLDQLAASQVPVIGVGKVDDLFAGRGITSTHAATNPDAYALIERRNGRTDRPACSSPT